ncbi:hypothetical protein ACSVC9_05240 [Clostridium sp. LBM24168]
MQENLKNCILLYLMYVNINKNFLKENIDTINLKDDLEGNIYSIKIAYQTLILFSDKIHVISYDNKNDVLSSKWYV